MILNKFNYQKHDYEDYEVPDHWNCKVYSNEMDLIVNCPQCGKELRYGECYTSLEIHTKLGMGYGVCSGCYESERKRKEEYYESNRFIK